MMCLSGRCSRGAVQSALSALTAVTERFDLLHVDTIFSGRNPLYVATVASHNSSIFDPLRAADIPTEIDTPNTTDFKTNTAFNGEICVETRARVALLPGIRGNLCCRSIPKSGYSVGTGVSDPMILDNPSVPIPPTTTDGVLPTTAVIPTGSNNLPLNYNLRLFYIQTNRPVRVYAAVYNSIKLRKMIVRGGYSVSVTSERYCLRCSARSSSERAS